MEKPAILYCFLLLFLVFLITVSGFSQKRTQIVNLIDATRELICLWQAFTASCRRQWFYHPFNSSCHMDLSMLIPLKVPDTKPEVTFDFIK